MIPKIVHYVWVGGGKKPDKVKKCIRSWHKLLPDYEFKEWNENNFDMSCSTFLKTAYQKKQWAFVSDYIRIYVLYRYGGVYLDTDVLLIKNIDNLLNNRVFVGFQDYYLPFTAAFGSVKAHPFLKSILDTYEDRFSNQTFNEQTIDEVVNTNFISEILINKYNCLPNNTEQTLKYEIHVFPDYYLCNPSLKSYAIHLYTGSWISGRGRLKKIIIDFDQKFRESCDNKVIAWLYWLTMGNLQFQRHKIVFKLKSK